MKKLSVSKQLLLGVVLSSTLITIFVTIIHLIQNYSSQIDITNDKLDTLMHTNKKSLEVSIWDLNKNQIDSVLQGIKSFQGIDYLQLSFESIDGVTKKELGELPTENLKKSYTLSHRNEEIGSILLVSSKQHIYNILWNELALVLALNAIKTFIASFFPRFFI